MKRYLVKFSKPLLLNFGGKNENYKTSYGFLGGYYDPNPELIKNEKINNRDFVFYLCAMSEWSRGEATFSVNDGKKWVDNDGVEHKWDKWTYSVAKKCWKKLGLVYSTYVIDVDDISDACYSCGIYSEQITCEALMDSLVELAEPLELIEEKSNAFLFNRPIWLPKNSFVGCDDPGHFAIFGVVNEGTLEDDLREYVKRYQGYLSMAEENYLSESTPSGFVDSDEDGEIYWYKNGMAYWITDKDIRDEGELCRKKNNLDIFKVIPDVPLKDLKAGLVGDLIVSQELYESLLDRR